MKFNQKQDNLPWSALGVLPLVLLLASLSGLLKCPTTRFQPLRAPNGEQTRLQAVCNELQRGFSGDDEGKNGSAGASPHRSPRKGVMNQTISIKDDVSHRLAELFLGVENREALHDDLGRRLANDLRDHFTEREIAGPRNKLGAPSSGFWADNAGSVNDGEIASDGVTVTISDHRFNQKVYGGPIRMDDVLLAIPARTEAYGKSPRIFSNLKFIFFANTGTKALVQFKPTEKRQKGEKRIGGVKDEGLVFYWLKEEVTQAADPKALPTREKMITGIIDTAEKHFNRLRDSGGGQPTES